MRGASRSSSGRSSSRRRLTTRRGRSSSHRVRTGSKSSDILHVMGKRRRMRLALLASFLVAGCSSGLTISYHPVPLGSDERTLMVLVSKDEQLDENPVALLDRLKLRPAEKLRVVVGRVGERSFAAIDSGSGTRIVTNEGPGTPEL